MRYSIPSSVMLQTIDDESLLMDEKTHLFYELNSSGAVFWEILKKHNIFIDTFNEILEYFDVSEDQLDSDFSKFVVDLKEQGILEIHES